MSEPRSVESINGEIGARESWARLTPAQRTRRTNGARDGLLAKFAREADPDGVLSPAARYQAGEELLKAHMLRISQLARAKKNGKKAPQSRPR